MNSGTNRSVHVQLPLGREGLSVNRTHVPFRHLPREAQDVYNEGVKYMKKKYRKVYQCQNCGYLSQSSGLSGSVVSGTDYNCNNCGAPSTKFDVVYMIDFDGEPNTEIDSSKYIDMTSIDPDDFPNAKSHLTQIRNNLKRWISTGELIDKLEHILVKEADEGNWVIPDPDESDREWLLRLERL